MADAAVAGEDLVAKVAGIGAEPVLVDAVVGAEGAPAFGEDLEFAPAAERQVVGSTGQYVGFDSATGEGAGEAHD